MRVDEAIRLYLAAHEGVHTPPTLRAYAATLRTLPPAVELHEVLAEDLVRWRAGLGPAPASANQYMTRVRSFFTWCEAARLTWGNPARAVPPLRAPAEPRKYLSPGQADLLLDCAYDERDRGALAVAREYLLRGGELADLKVGWVDFEARRLTVHVEKKEGSPYEWDRLVLTDEVESALRQWLRHYRSVCGLVGDGAYLFPSRVEWLSGTERQRTYRPYQRMGKPHHVVSRALAAMGLARDKAGVHDTRRSMARIRYDELVAADIPDPVGIISALLHHENRKTTELYLGVSGDRDRRDKIMQSHVWRASQSLLSHAR